MSSIIIETQNSHIRNIAAMLANNSMLWYSALYFFMKISTKMQKIIDKILGSLFPASAGRSSPNKKTAKKNKNKKSNRKNIPDMDLDK